MSEEATNSEGLPPEDETSLPESAEVSETQEVEAPEEESSEAQQPKKNTAKDRIDELTRLRREAERDRDYYRELALRSPQQPAQPQPQQPQAEQAPNPEAYDAGEFDTRYIKDVARWEAKQEVAQALHAVNAQSHAMQAEVQWQSRVEKVAETLPDFEEKVVLGAQRQEWSCSPVMAEVIRSTDKGPELAYHLATNPAEAARISRLPPVLQPLELGKLEAKLSQPKSKTVTNAPQPIPQTRGSGGQFKAQPDTDDFTAFERAYGNG